MSANKKLLEALLAGYNYADTYGREDDGTLTYAAQTTVDKILPEIKKLRCNIKRNHPHQNN